MKISSLATLLVVLTVVGCSDVTDTSTSLRGRIDPQKLGIATTDSLVGLLVYSTGVLHESDAEPMESSVVQGFFANNDGFKDVTSAQVNNQALSRVYEGQYVLDNPTVPTGSNPTLSWIVSGFLGSTYSKTYDLAKPMELSTFGYLDTVHASSGASIGYSGSNGSGNLTVTVTYDKALSEVEIHADSTSGGGYFEKVVSDGGTISLTTSDLSTLTPYRVYNLEFTHDAYTSEIYQGAKVGHYTSYSVFVSFILEP